VMADRASGCTASAACAMRLRTESGCTMHEPAEQQPLV
jgi:hypothetical protein